MASPASFIFLLLLSISAASVSSQPAQTAQNNWEWLLGLSKMTPTEFGKAIRPMLLITINAYRATQTALSIAGWQLTSSVPPLNIDEKAGPGVHAVSYEETSTGRIVVAFKGATSPSDYCAAGGLMGGTFSISKGLECKPYTAQSLDYLSQATAYVSRVMKAYPDRPLLISGHSMGSFLAVLTSALLSSAQPSVILPVLSFSGTVDKGILANKGLVLRAAEKGMAYVVSNKWDFVGNPTKFGRNEFAHAGMLCTFGSQKPPACNACKSNGNPLAIGGACGECFSQAHALESLLQLIDSGALATCS